MQRKIDVKLLYDERQIISRVREVADEVMAGYLESDSPIVCICVLRGAVLFFADLVKSMSSDRLILDFIRVSSYGENTKTSGKVELAEAMSEEVANKHVLIVEDIIDSGMTVQFLRDYFSKLNPIDVKVVTLLDKPMARKVDANADYVGFYLRNSSFVVGYGLDYDQSYRNLNGIFEVLKK